MVRNNDLKKDLKGIRESLLKFKSSYHISPPLSLGIPIAFWSLAAFKEYYRIRKEIIRVQHAGKLYKEIPKLSFNVWILIQYGFETVFIICHLIMFIIYILKVPVYKGMISFYIGFFFLSYFFLGQHIIYFNEKVFRRLNMAVDTIDKLSKKKEL